MLLSSQVSMGRSKLQLIIEIAIFAALAFVFSLIRLYRMPQGGSINLEMLPILVIALRRGPSTGVVTGVLFGILSSFLDSYIVHPIQFLTDYPLAFGAIGLAGIFSNQLHSNISKNKNTIIPIVSAVLTAFIGRTAFHTISGIVFFGSGEVGLNAINISLGYNLTYMVPTSIICAIILMILPKNFFTVK